MDIWAGSSRAFVGRGDWEQCCDAVMLTWSRNSKQCFQPLVQSPAQGNEAVFSVKKDLQYPVLAMAFLIKCLVHVFQMALNLVGSFSPQTLSCTQGDILWVKWAKERLWYCFSRVFCRTHQKLFLFLRWVFQEVSSMAQGLYASQGNTQDECTLLTNCLICTDYILVSHIQYVV